MPTTFSPPEVEKEKLEDLTPLYHVVLLDDDYHTYDYVIEMLVKLFAYSEADAYRRAEEVDRTGRTVVITCGLAEAEFARDQIHGYGPDFRMAKSKGSMTAIIEPVGNSEFIA